MVTYEFTDKLRRFFPAAQTLALDIETTGLNFWSDKVTCISLSDGSTSVVIDLRNLDPVFVKTWLKLHVYDRGVIVHDGAFDFTFLNQVFECGYPKSYHDTMLAEQLLIAGADRSVSVSLKDVALRRLAVVLTKDEEVRTGFVFGVIWSEDQIKYSANDVAYLHRIANQQITEIENLYLLSVWQIENKCLPVFCDIRRYGIQLDSDRLKSLLNKTADTLTEVKSKLEAVLTPQVVKSWQGQNDKIVSELQEWENAGAAIETDKTAEWYSCCQQPTYQEALVYLFNLDLAQTKDNFFDITPDKDGKPKGLKRFIRRFMQAYRKGNPKPAAKLIDLSEVINLRSNQQLKQATENYFKEYNQRHKAKLDPPVNFSAKTLKGMLGEMPDEINEDLLKPLLVFKKSSKLIDAFGEKLLEMVNPVTGRLHGNWKQIGTATGRPTCAKPNLLQMPSDGSFRSCFVAAAGYLLVVADFSQIELRIMAELSNDATFIDAFVSGKDLHRLTASNIYHLPPEEINDKQRKVAKIVNFATLYGIGPKGLLTQIVAEGQKMTKAEAAQALDGWRKTYPQAAELIEKWGYQAVKLGYTTTAFGRRRNFNIYGEMNLEIEGIIKRAGANHPIQGTNADMTKLAMVGINDRLATYGCRIVAQVYDEIITEVPEDKAAFAASVIKETMVAAAKPVLKTVPVAVDTTISKTWNEKDGFSLEDLEAE